ncbi:MAG: hypothetical protein F6K32_23045 [Desertifilum sp. SIO1I2]|nr:hypothetical protein [Desertifilum sp. SIO1I2]
MKDLKQILQNECYGKDLEQQRQTLFARLREVLEQNGITIQLSYVSAFHIARPN